MFLNCLLALSATAMHVGKSGAFYTLRWGHPIQFKQPSPTLHGFGGDQAAGHSGEHGSGSGGSPSLGGVGNHCCLFIMLRSSFSLDLLAGYTVGLL